MTDDRRWDGGDASRIEALEAEVVDMEKRITRDYQLIKQWQDVANRWRCCEAGIIAAPDPCPWHGDGVRDEKLLA